MRTAGQYSNIGFKRYSGFASGITCREKKTGTYIERFTEFNIAIRRTFGQKMDFAFSETASESSKHTSGLTGESCRTLTRNFAKVRLQKIHTEAGGVGSGLMHRGVDS